MAVPLDAKEIACDGEDLTDLAPLTRLTSLETLSLRFTRVTDLSPLQGLTALRELTIAGCRTYEERERYGCHGDEKPDPSIGYVPLAAYTPVTDISPLARLTRLEVLHLDSTGVSDLTPLTGLERLRELTISWTKVKRVPPLPRTLETFVANNAPIEDIEGLRDLPALAVLSLYACNVASLEALGHDTSLRDLRFWSLYPRLRSLHGLESLTALTALTLADLDAAALDPLAGMTRLQQLDIQGGSVLGLTALSGLKGLERLMLDAWDGSPTRHGVLDLAPLGKLTQLRELTLQGNPGSLRPLAPLTRLEKVSLRGDNRNWERFDLAPFAGAKGLTSLKIDEGEPTRLGDLAALTSLESLDFINANGGPSLQPLGKLTRLTHLHVDHWAKLDTATLAPLTHLTRLQLSAHDITSLAPLAGLTSLRDLLLDVKAPLAVDALAPLTGLRSLDLRDTPVSGIAALGSLSNLRSFIALNPGPALLDLGVTAKWSQLETLDLANAPSLRSLEPLRDSSHLAYVSLRSVPVTDSAPLTALPALRMLYLLRTAIPREEESRLLQRIGGCHSRSCSDWPDLRKSYRHTFR